MNCRISDYHTYSHRMLYYSPLAFLLFISSYTDYNRVLGQKHEFYSFNEAIKRVNV